MNAYGAIFVNTRKEKDAHPDWTGDIRIKDQNIEYRIAGWVKKDKNGNDYISLNVSDKRETRPQ